MDAAVARCHYRFAEVRCGKVHKRLLRVPVVHYSIDGTPAVLDTLSIGGGVRTFRFASYLERPAADRFEMTRKTIDRLEVAPHGAVEPSSVSTSLRSPVAKAVLESREAVAVLKRSASSLTLRGVATPWRTGPAGHDVLVLHLSRLIQDVAELDEAGRGFDAVTRAARNAR